MEHITSFTFLYHKGSGDTTFSKLCDITSYPDIYTPPERIDISDMSSNYKKYTKGMIDVPDYEFGANFTKAQYAVVKALEGTEEDYYQIRFGENGEYGAWQWQGGIFVTPLGGAVGDKRSATIKCYQSSIVTEVDVTKVYIVPLADQNIVVGTDLDLEVFPIPSDATVTAVSGTVGTATASVAGHMLTIHPVTSGTTVVTITAAKAGLTSGTETITVTVSAT